MNRNTSVSLGAHFETFINNTVSTGRFNNASEVIRAGLQLLENEEAKVIALKAALQEGEDSEVIENFNPKEFLKELKSKYE